MFRPPSWRNLLSISVHPGWDASPSQGYPSIKFGTHLYTWVERGTVRVGCLAQEHSTVSPARARTRTAQPEDERTKHEATAPPSPPFSRKLLKYCCVNQTVLGQSSSSETATGKLSPTPSSVLSNTVPATSSAVLSNSVPATSSTNLGTAGTISPTTTLLTTKPSEGPTGSTEVPTTPSQRGKSK